MTSCVGSKGANSAGLKRDVASCVKTYTQFTSKYLQQAVQ